MCDAHPTWLSFLMRMPNTPPIFDQLLQDDSGPMHETQDWNWDAAKSTPLQMWLSIYTFKALVIHWEPSTPLSWNHCCKSLDTDLLLLLLTWLTGFIHRKILLNLVVWNRSHNFPSNSCGGITNDDMVRYEHIPISVIFIIHKPTP